MPEKRPYQDDSRPVRIYDLNELDRATAERRRIQTQKLLRALENYRIYPGPGK